MSIFYDISGVVLDVASLILPRACLVCGKALPEGEEEICLACQYSMPLVDFSDMEVNPIKRLFENNLSIEAATAMYWFTSDTGWRDLIHRFKYAGRWYFARKMGELLGRKLQDSGDFEDVDLIVAIPLHYRRRLARGYNQSEQLALGIGHQIGVKCDFGSVRRSHYNKSQTSKRRSERWENVAEIFEVRRADRLRGHHILLVDDVLTTGATISSCAKAILEACEGDVRISVATLSVTRRVQEYR